MADDERSEDTGASRRRSSAGRNIEEKSDHGTTRKPSIKDAEYQPIDGKSEAQARMEADAKRRSERAAEEWKEYQEMRREEKEKEDRDIQELRDRKQQRKIKRAEEEKRLAELRLIEEQKRRAEDEERQRRKKEEEQRKQEERERKRAEAEERLKNQNKKPNFVISKRAGLIPTNGEEEPSKEEIAKSKEQLEAERKAVLEQRVQPLNTNGFNLQQLQEKAKELHSKLYSLESEKYDLTQQFQRQNMDLMELAERARQMNKGGKEKKVNMSQQDALSSTMSRAPAKIVMYSQFERVKDPRDFKDRQTCFTGSMYGEEYVRIEPTSKVEMGDQGAVAVGPYTGPSEPMVNGEPENNATEVPVA